MGRPRDPDYWRKWRAAHPDYRERERVRLRARDRTGRDRSGEKRKLRMDLAQEAALAAFEGADPAERCRAYRIREIGWRTMTLPIEAVA